MRCGAAALALETLLGFLLLAVFIPVRLLRGDAHYGRPAGAAPGAGLTAAPGRSFRRVRRPAIGRRGETQPGMLLLFYASLMTQA